MKNYNHIVEMEKILTSYRKQLNELEYSLESLEQSLEAYKKLISYYYSEQRDLDLEDDRNHLIPDDLNRGVLSEDEIYDLMGEHHELAIKMMEVALAMLKNNVPELETKEIENT